MTVVQLRELAREKKVRLPYGVNKAQIVELLGRELEPAAGKEWAGPAHEAPSGVSPAALQAAASAQSGPSAREDAGHAAPAQCAAHVGASAQCAPDGSAACDEQDDERIGLYKPKPLGYYNEEYGTSNPVNCVKATIAGLAQLRTAEQVAALRGKTVEEIIG